MTSPKTLAQPILKWASGKEKLFTPIPSYLPPELKMVPIETYIETLSARTQGYAQQF
jgi:hypothetical protein